jgi:hypothetical protein
LNFAAIARDQTAGQSSEAKNETARQFSRVGPLDSPKKNWQQNEQLRNALNQRG